jgi:Xrn1 helical domain/Xrn1 SH3-like domain
MPYRLLMTHPSSPIKEKYPTDFQVDLNGKRNDWEAVVLLPFMDEDSLLAAVQSIPFSELTPGERARNSHGPSKHFLSSREADFAAKVASPFPTRLPDFTTTAACVELKLPFVDHGVPFPCSWTAGTHAPGTHPDVADLPSFRPLVHSGRLEVTGVDVFGQSAKGESLLVTLGTRSSEDRDFITFDSVEDNETAAVGTTTRHRDRSELNDPAPECSPVYWSTKGAAIASGLGPGSAVWVRYPWRLLAVVHSLSDKHNRVTQVKANGDGDTVEEPVSEDSFVLRANTAAATLMGSRAIDSGRPCIVIDANAVERKDALTGSPIQFSASPATYIAQTVIPMGLNDAEGLAASVVAAANQSTPICSPFSVGERVLVVGRNTFCGCRAYVEKCNDDGKYLVSLSVRAQYAREPAFGYRVVAQARASERWVSTGKAASIVGLAVPVLLTITGSVRVRVPNSPKEEIDIGLGIRYSGRGLFVPGYARIDEHGSFLLSQKTTDLVSSYRQNFPELFRSLTSRSMENQDSKRTQRGAGRAFEASDLFGSLSDPKNALIAAASWVATSELATLPLVAEGALVLPKYAIMELEKEASLATDLQADAMKFGEGERRRAQVVLPRWLCCNGRESSEVYASMMAQGAAETLADKSVQVRLGDRVVNRLAVGPVPFGLRGTVVGVHVGKSSSSKNENAEEDDASMKESVVTLNSNLVEVLFDEGFIGGGDLNGRCSATRGKAVNADTLIILRPDRENQYYNSNYARVARAYSTRHANELSLAKQESEQRALETTAIANAAVLSYADATKGARITTQSEPRFAVVPEPAAVSYEPRHTGSNSARPEGQKSWPSPQDFPIPSFVRGLPGPSGLRSEHKTVTSSNAIISVPEREQASSSVADTGVTDEALVHAFDLESVEKRLKQMLNLSGASAKASGANMRNDTSVAARSSAPVEQGSSCEAGGSSGRGAGIAGSRAKKNVGNRGRGRGRAVSRPAGRGGGSVEHDERGRGSRAPAGNSTSSDVDSTGVLGNAATRNGGRGRGQPQNEFTTRSTTNTERGRGRGRGRGRSHGAPGARTGAASSDVVQNASPVGEADDEIVRFWKQLQSDK